MQKLTFDQCDLEKPLNFTRFEAWRLGVQLSKIRSQLSRLFFSTLYGLDILEHFIPDIFSIAIHCELSTKPLFGDTLSIDCIGAIEAYKKVSTASVSIFGKASMTCFCKTSLSWFIFKISYFIPSVTYKPRLWKYANLTGECKLLNEKFRECYNPNMQPTPDIKRREKGEKGTHARQTHTRTRSMQTIPTLKRANHNATQVRKTWELGAR